MNLKGNLTSKGLQGSIGKSRMQGILGTNPAAIPITVDNALSLSSTNPVQNRVITAAITNRLWSDEVKTALLQIVEKVAYIDADGQDYYDALYDALYPPTNLDSIGAVFDSYATIYNTMTLDDLKQYLTVTAYFTDGTSETVTTYTLSGSMDAGTQTITVSYGGKTTTFTVTVVEWVVSISAVFTQGSATIYDTDSLDTLEQYLVVTATFADSTTATVSDYTLSGTLTAGTSTITASYGGKTDTFNVTVTAAPVYHLPNKTTETSNYRLTTTVGGHVKFEALQQITNADEGSYIRFQLYTGERGNGDFTINRYTLPAGSYDLYVDGITDSTNRQYRVTVFETNNIQSSGWILGTYDGTHEGGDTRTMTLSTQKDVCNIALLILYSNTVIASGTVIEFDLSITSNGVRYV